MPNLLLWIALAALVACTQQNLPSRPARDLFTQGHSPGADCPGQYAETVPRTHLFLYCWGDSTPASKKMAASADDDMAIIPAAKPFAVIVLMDCDKKVRIIAWDAKGNVSVMPAKGIPEGYLASEIRRVSADHVGYLPLPDGRCGKHKDMKPAPRGGANL